MELGGLVVLVVLAAAMGEGVIEFIPVPILDWLKVTDKGVRTVILNLLSALLGVGIACNFHLGLFTFLGAAGDIEIVDQIITGVLIGRGSNYIHGLIKRFVLKEETALSSSKYSY